MVKDKNLLYRGSVKDIYLNPEDDKELIFKFSNRYSVFDWGEMPDQLDGKGAALAQMGQFFFDYLGDAKSWKEWRGSPEFKAGELDILKKFKREGLRHHALGLNPREESSFLVKKVEVPSIPFTEGNYNYDYYQKRPLHTLIPLEVVFRFGLPQGSSLFERIQDKDYRQVLGLYHRPIEGERFSRPLIEFSTKLEATDRYIDYDKAQRISGMSDLEFSELYGQTVVLAHRLKDIFEESGIELWDGKFEWAFGEHEEAESLQRSLQLVDSIGPDELRLMKDGQKLSKEFLRGFYRQSEWLKAVEKAKKMARERASNEWHRIVEEELHQWPRPLSPLFKTTAAGLYPALTNELLNNAGREKAFKNAPTLNEIVEQMKKCEIKE